MKTIVRTEWFWSNNRIIEVCRGVGLDAVKVTRTSGLHATVTLRDGRTLKLRDGQRIDGILPPKTNY